jgi:hypothetical protein
MKLKKSVKGKVDAKDNILKHAPSYAMGNHSKRMDADHMLVRMLPFLWNGLKQINSGLL